MTTSLPSVARKHFDKKAEELVKKLEPLGNSVERSPIRKRLSDDDKPTQIIDSVESIRVVGAVNGEGNEITREFMIDGGRIGLAGESLRDFERLAENLLSRREIRDLLSVAFLKETIFTWLEGKYIGGRGEGVAFTNYLDDKVAEAVREQRIAIPIPGLAIEEAFCFGRVRFEPIVPEMFDRWREHLQERGENRKSTAEDFLVRMRKEYQGTVVAVLSVRAEIERGIERALGESDLSLSLLRFFSPYALSPHIPHFVDLAGRRSVPQIHILILDDYIKEVIKRVDAPLASLRWPITVENLHRFKEHGFDQAHELLMNERRSDLEQLLLTCLKMFSTAVKAGPLLDKLVFLLSSAETLLLMDSTEPIQLALGQRLAMLSADDLEERKSVISLVKAAYKMRSSYLHHGNQAADVSVVVDLQQTIWTGLRNTLVNKDSFPTQEALIGALTDELLG